MRDTVRFMLAGRVEEVRDCAPTDTVLDYLRTRRGLKGTKEGCSEGDCGACTVVVGEPDGEGIRYRAVNACILFLPMLDGKLLLTVEDLQTEDGGLHPVQQAMVDCHASQCGFCTPGIVMSLFAMYHNRAERPPERAEIDLGLAGNLCRCTGYAPIVRAARQALVAGRRDGFDRSPERLAKELLRLGEGGMLDLRNGSGRFAAPRDGEALSRLLEECPDATLVAGATDVGLWVTKDLRSFPTLVYTGEVGELKAVEYDRAEGWLSIGAAVTYSDAVEAISEAYPVFRPLIERLGAVQVRNAGTVGGNIANGSPIADMPPGLIAAGSRLVLRSASGRRTIDLEDFFLEYGRQDLRPGEYLEKVLLPLPPPGLVFRTYKVSKRFEQDISAVCAGFAFRVLDGRIATARVCYGGMAGTPLRARHCEQAIEGEPWEERTVRAGMRALDDDFEPISDMRASREYRIEVARNLLRRCYLEQAETPWPVTLEAKYG